MILLSCKLRANADRLALAALEDLIRWASINTIYWSDNDSLYVFESHLKASELVEELSSSEEISAFLDHAIALDVQLLKGIGVVGLPSEKILRAFLEDCLR